MTTAGDKPHFPNANDRNHEINHSGIFSQREQMTANVNYRAGEFVTKKKGDYYFADATGRAVALPGKPYLALCIRRS